MSTFTFEGFTEGSLVALSAAQGAQNASGSVPEWGLNNMNTATIDIARIEPGEIVAPVGIWFEATGLEGFNVTENTTDRDYDPSAHEITYIWDFNDPGTFTAPLNIPTAWNNRNVEYGKTSYHVFDQPGTYVVSLWAVDRQGVTGQRMISITVADPDQVYAGTRTICVSNQGNFAGAPAGAQQVSSFIAGAQALQSLGQTGRILLRAGETYAEPRLDVGGMANFRLGTFGSGAKPVMRPAEPVPGSSNGSNVFSFANGNTVADSMVYGLRFQGDWDAAQETGDGRSDPISYGTHNNVAWNVCLYQCEFDGWNSLGPNNDNVPSMTSAIVDCEITNWRTYGLFIGGTVYNENHRVALVGTAIHAKENACRGEKGTGRLSNVYGAMRYSVLLNLHVSATSFYTASTPVGGLQPCLRLAQNRSDQTPLAPGTGYFINFNRVVCEGGSVIIGVDGQNAGANEIPGNHIFDKMLLVGDYDTVQWANISYGGSTVRNTVFVNPNVPRRPGQNPIESFLYTRVDRPAPGNADAPMTFTHNTFLNLASGSTITTETGRENFSAYTLANNVNHQPNAGVTSDGPIQLSQSIAGVRTLNRGIRLSPDRVTVSVSGIGNGQSFTIGYPAGTGPSDFSPDGRHTVQANNGFWYSHKGHCTLAFGPSNITVTNLSNAPINGGAEVALDQNTLTTNMTYGSPETVPLPVPQGGSQALVDEGGPTAYTQFDTAQRIRPKGAI